LVLKVIEDLALELRAEKYYLQIRWNKIRKKGVGRWVEIVLQNIEFLGESRHSLLFN